MTRIPIPENNREDAKIRAKAIYKKNKRWIEDRIVYHKRQLISAMNEHSALTGSGPVRDVSITPVADKPRDNGKNSGPTEPVRFRKFIANLLRLSGQGTE